MEKILRVERIVCDDAEYKYELIEEAATEQCVGAPSRYSIKITMLCFGEYTEASTNFIFTRLERASQTYKSLKENLVTPKNLEYVLIDEKIIC